MGKSTFLTAAAVLIAGASAQLFPRQNATMTTSTPLGTALTSLTTSSSSTTPIISATVPINSSNGTSTTSTSSAAPTASDPVFCPALAGKETTVLDVIFEIACDLNYIGVQILIDLTKRQTATSLQDCLDACAALDQCVATAYDTNNPQCYFYSSITDAFTANGFEFGEVMSRPSNTTTTSATSMASTGTSIPTGSATDAPYPTGNNSTTPITSSTSQTTTDGTTASGTTPSGTTGPVTTGSSSTSGTGSAVSVPTASPTDMFCPALDLQIYINGLGISFIIECATAHFGVIIDIIISKRQAIGGADSLDDCLTLCSNNAACVGTAFNTVAGTCTLYSSIGASYTDPDVEFAIEVAPAATATPGETITVPVYETQTITVSSCAPTVTDCPLGSVVTDTIIVDSTVYVCPSYTTYPASPIACTSCPYEPVTATAYSTTVVTISSCAPTVTDCPYDSNGVNTAGANGGSGVTTVTTSCAAGETVTVSGTTTVLATATVITSTVGSSGSGSGSGSGSDSDSGVTAVTSTGVTAVATTVVNYPVPTSTGAAATGSASIVSSIAASGTAGSGSSSGTSSGSSSGSGSGSSSGSSRPD